MKKRKHRLVDDNKDNIVGDPSYQMNNKHISITTMRSGAEEIDPVISLGSMGVLDFLFYPV